jgi:hypothetical protein
MYKPVRPFVVAPLDKKDKRPFLGPSFMASRIVAVKVADCDFVCKKCKDGIVVYCEPKMKKEMKKERKIRR